MMADFIELTYDDERMTCKMPADETIVEVQLADGLVCRAFYSQNIMEAGDWDFAPVDEDDEPTDGSFPIEVVAWRHERPTP